MNISYHPKILKILNARNSKCFCNNLLLNYNDTLQCLNNINPPHIKMWSSNLNEINEIGIQIDEFFLFESFTENKITLHYNKHFFNYYDFEIDWTSMDKIINVINLLKTFQC